MRYQGQGHEIEITLPKSRDAGELFAGLAELFGATYQASFTLRLDEPLEIVNWKVEAAAPAPKLGADAKLSGKEGSGKARKGTRRAYDPASNALTDWPVHDRYALKPGDAIDGPALIEEHESTCVVGAGDRVTVDARLNLVAELAAV